MIDFTDEKLLSLDATQLFESDEWGDNNNMRYCRDRATFTHKNYDSIHSVTEFILHIGQDDAEESPYWKAEVQWMKSYRCSDEFIQTYIQAEKLGAVRLMLWK